MVAITGGPESEALIRRATRIAARAGAELMVLTILRGDGLTGMPPHAIARFRKLAEDLRATFHTVVGDDVPTALLDFARGANATQLVLGTSRRSRFARVFDEGIGATVVQRSGPIDVHMVTHDEANPGWRLRPGRVPATRSRQLLGRAMAIALPALMTGIGLVLRDQLSVSTDVVGYFLATARARTEAALLASCAQPDEADVDVPVTPDVHLALRGETDQLRTALLSAVGHDLRTRLTAIKAAVGSLRAPDRRPGPRPLTARPRRRPGFVHLGRVASERRKGRVRLRR